MKPGKYIWLLSIICLFLLGIANNSCAQRWNPSHSVGTVSGNYNYQYGQTPDQLVEIFPAAIATGSLQYQWQSSATLNEGDFQAAPGTNNQTGYSPGQLFQTTYYRRKTTYTPTGAFVYSNIIKLSLVSVNWENRNYVRVYDVKVTGVTTAQAIDQLPIGQKLQTTSYVDGLGRSAEKVSRETATPAQTGGAWGDVVQFSNFDEFGRQPKKYLAYTTTTESGKYKTAPLTEQPQYYTSVYNETSAYTTITFDNSPLKREMNIREPGTAWGASAGNSIVYDVNNATENVQSFGVDYVQGNPPVNRGAYAAGALYKAIYTDVNNKKIIEYFDKEGRVVLRKIQSDDVPGNAHSGWMCTYYVYDDFGLLRYLLQPEAVNYLDAHSWSFAGTNGQSVLNGYCYQYSYDERGRTTWKKSPDAAPLQMLYDARSRLVLTQDGNQAALSPAQWTASLYDELDRTVITTLYNTTKSVTALQADIDNGTPVSATDLNNASVTTIVKYQYYDDYTFAGARSFNTGFTNTSAYNTSDPNVQPITSSARTLSQPTGNVTRVLGTSIFLTTTCYYDDKGRAIQTLQDNIRGGIEITTSQYHFDGRLLSTCNSHTTTGTGYSNFITLNKYNFDKIGRVTSIQKQLGSNAFKTIASYDYDDMTRIKAKNLDPDYTNGSRVGLEKLNYSYNCHSQLTGINKDYALKNPSNYNKWDHFFGMYLGYDNRDNVFAKARLNEQITGAVWNTQGDDAQRKYDYSYDNASRLTNADFMEQQHPGDGWANNKMDFSVSGSSGKITYDLNGNMLSMVQKGVQAGNAAPLVVDNLSYTYAAYSNKLQSVSDAMTATSVNGQFGDFKDGSNGSAPDYVYDNNGNLVIDLNKNAKDLGNVVGANGIHYNFLDKPDEIRIAGKGTIKIVYNGDGQKLQRVFTPENGGAAATTTYINQFVYQATGSNADVLSFINMEEGRIRVITPTAQNNGYDAVAIDGNIDLPNGKKGVFDYFIVDYQENVRMVLTEETHSAYNTCTMETGRASAEDPVFGQTGSSNEVEITRYPTPAGWQSVNTSSSVSRLGNTAGHNIGPNSLQKVMAGDQVSATVQYYYQDAASGNNPNFVSTLLTSLGQAITGSAAGNLVKGNVAGITSGLNGTSGFVNAVQPTGSGGTTPQAYLTILFFDERFKFIEAVDGGVAQQQVSVAGTGASPLALGSIKAPKNGYAYAYVSNQSDQDVYFDNLQVGITRGNIIEETHYYAYGLKIAAISSGKPGDVNEGQLRNKYQWQGEYSEFDDDLNWNDYALRSYDPQMGRFVQVDPFNQFPSPYTGLGNDPVNFVDPNGGFAVNFGTLGALTGSVLLDRALVTVAGATIGFGIDKLTGGNGWTGAAIGGGVALGATFIPPFDIGAIGGILKGAAPAISVQGSNMVSNAVNTETTKQIVQNAVYDATDNPCQQKYKGYDKNKDVESYNCAGLALRTYRFMGLEEVEDILEKNKKTSGGKEGDIKVWLWTYDIHLELEDGTVASPTSHDFHIVGGLLGPGGKDPVNVYTKNGHRPVFGPGKGPDFKPVPRDQAMSNDRLNTPQFYRGQKVMKVRTNMVQRIYILPCMNF